MQINPADITIETFSTGGSPWIRANNNGIRITHKPTNTVVNVSSERSQHANKAIAINNLRTILEATTDFNKQMVFEF